MPPSFDRAEAAEAVLSSIDYFCGRNIKADLSGDSFDPHSYNRDSDTLAADVIASLRGGAKPVDRCNVLRDVKDKPRFTFVPMKTPVAPKRCFYCHVASAPKTIHRRAACTSCAIYFGDHAAMKTTLDKSDGVESS